MRNAFWLASLLGIAVLMLAGCEGGTTPPAQPREGQQVPIFREFRGQQGPFPDRGFFVVQRPEVWEALWGYRQVPDVDFSQQTVLVALLGQQPTAGYDIRITEVRTTGQQVNVYVQETRPQPGSIVAQVISYPYHMVVVPKITQPVYFVVDGAAIQPITFVDSYQGQQSNAVDPQTVVIRDQTAWRRMWTDNFGETVAAPPVDFTQYMAVGVFMGRRPTGGYVVTIASVERVADRLVVNYRTRVPQAGEVVTQALTSPYAIAIIPASPLPVTFRDVAVPAQ